MQVNSSCDWKIAPKGINLRKGGLKALGQTVVDKRMGLWKSCWSM